MFTSITQKAILSSMVLTCILIKVILIILINNNNFSKFVVITKVMFLHCLEQMGMERLP